MTDDKGFRARALGEIAIRCADMGAMVAFYTDVIGLERLRGGQGDPIVFFRISEGFGGHTNVLALFRNDVGARSDPGPPETGARSSLHHIALSLPFAEQAAVMAWYDKKRQPYRVEHFKWAGWRGIFTEDPEGNTVEFVAHCEDLPDQPSG